MKLNTEAEKRVKKILKNCKEKAADQFNRFVRPIYEQLNSNRPYSSVGSCVLLTIQNRRYLVTAAHILAEFPNTSLYIQGANNEPVKIEGLYENNINYINERLNNRTDFAWVELSKEKVRLCGENDFILEENIATPNSPEGRLYVALGYPCSRTQTYDKKTSPGGILYCDFIKNDKALCKELSISGEKHFILKHNQLYKFDDEKIGNAMKLNGISGGALIDMGLATEWDKSANKPNGKLAGILTEAYKKYNAIVAVKISNIVDSIKQE